MAEFNTETESGDGKQDRGTGHSFGGADQPAGKTQAVKEAEEKGCEGAHPTTAALRPEDIGDSDENDARGDHRFDHAGGQTENVQDRECEGDGMSEGKGGYHLQQIPKSPGSQDQS